MTALDQRSRAVSPLDRLPRPVVHPQDRGPIPRPPVVDEVRRHGPPPSTPTAPEPHFWPLELSRQQLLNHTVDASCLSRCRTRTIPSDEPLDLPEISESRGREDEVHLKPVET